MKNFAGIIFFVILNILSINNVFAQRKKSAILQNDPVSGFGRILLSDGNELKGKLRFNDNTGVVSWENDGVSRSFTSKDVSTFEFFDHGYGRPRIFYALEYADPDTGISNYCFFEVLKEFKSFAVLAKIDRVKAEPRRKLLHPYAAPTLIDKTSSGTIASQTETIFFINSEGEIEPYLQIIEKETEGRLLDYNRTENKLIKGKLFEQYTGEYFNELNFFAEENKLSFKQKKDLITILDHYEDLVSQ